MISSSISDCTRWRSSGTSVVCEVWVLRSTVTQTSFCEIVRSMMSSVILLTTKWSGVTSPETTDSPKPKFESITITERSPLAGWIVNITPAV